MNNFLVGELESAESGEILFSLDHLVSAMDYGNGKTRITLSNGSVHVIGVTLSELKELIGGVC